MDRSQQLDVFSRPHNDQFSEERKLTGTTSTPPGQWPEVARNWQHIRSPLRPTPEDVHSFSQVIDTWVRDNPGRAPHSLILGVTPELYALPWPDPALLRAADRTRAMIDYVWPGPAEAAIHSDWLALDLPDASLDLILCDGGLIMPDYPHGQQTLCHNIGRMLTPGGLTAFRLYVPPSRHETAAEVFQALEQGTIPDLNCLKLRLGMAMQPSAEQGVALADVWAALREQAGSGWEELASRLNWPCDALRIIDAYRDSLARYSFTTTEQAIALFQASGLEHLQTFHHSYTMGDQCPIVVFRKPPQHQQ